MERVIRREGMEKNIEIEKRREEKMKREEELKIGER